MAIKFIPGKVYLRNRVNGRIYEYEKNLASIANIEQYVPLPVEELEEVTEPELPLEAELDLSTGPVIDTVGHIATGTVAGDEKPKLAVPPAAAKPSLTGKTIAPNPGVKPPAPKPPAPPKGN